MKLRISSTWTASGDLFSQACATHRMLDPKKDGFGLPPPEWITVQAVYSSQVNAVSHYVPKS